MNVSELVLDVRKRIMSVPNEDVRFGLMATYLLAARASEIVGVASEHDTTTPYGPRGIDATEELWHEGLVNESAAVFRLKTAKRKGLERFVAIPLNPNYEPWSRSLLNYFQSKKTELVFPFTRQVLHLSASQVFSGLKYDIESYYPTSQDDNSKIIERHQRNAAVHFLRHLRASELTWFYGFGKEPACLAAYCGWTLKSAGYSKSMARYLILDWQGYFSKLLKPR